MKSPVLIQTAAALLLSGAGCAVAAPQLSVTGPANVQQGRSATLQLRLTDGAQPYGGFNARIALPKGMSVTGVTAGALLPPGFTTDYLVTQDAANVWVAVLAYSGTASIAGTNGILLNIMLQASTTATAGTYRVAFASSNANPVINSMHALADVHGAQSISHTVTGTQITINAAGLDSDGDGVPDIADAFPQDPAEWLDTDHDGIGNNADTDDDNDGVPDTLDNCPVQANRDQADADRDGIGDVCEPDYFCWECLPNRGGWRAILHQ
jgi:hypothetical protein